MEMGKSKRKTDRELFRLVSEKITRNEYFFTNHAKQRLIERELLEPEILDILSGKPGKKRRRNKAKEKYMADCQNWNYCVEGMGVNKNKIRIIFSFSKENIVIITVINMN